MKYQSDPCIFKRGPIPCVVQKNPLPKSCRGSVWPGFGMACMGFGVACLGCGVIWMVWMGCGLGSVS